MNTTTPVPHGPPYDVILFDCDSTLCRMEGLDELAERAGMLEKLRPVTEAAMNGTISFDSAYAERMALLRPDRAAVAWLAQRYSETLLEDAAALVRELQSRGKPVYIISSGIRQALLPLAEPLGIPDYHIHAVDLLFDEHGQYAGYDEQTPLIHQHGKAEVCRELIPYGGTAVMIGDGITDYEATGAGVDFIGFGGIVRRPAIEQRAARFYTQPDLLGLLPWLLSEAEFEEVKEPVRE